MATATVTISNVRLEGTNTLVPGSVVGSDPWNDASAGTYTENTFSSRTTPGLADGVEDAVADLSLPVAVGTLNSITLDADVTATNSGATGTDHRVSISFHDPTAGEVTNFTGGPLLLVGGSLETVTSGITTLGTDPATLTTFLLPALNGGTLHVVRRTNSGDDVPSDYTIRVHRLVLTIDYEPAGPPTTKPATRLHPRDDNLGLGSPRLYPLPKAVGRVVGGYQ